MKVLRRREAGGNRQDTGSNRVEAGGWRVEAVGPKSLRPKPYDLNPKPYSLQPMAADRRFGKYGPMDSHEVRKPDVIGQSYLEQARKVREMLRSMKPDAVSQIIEFRKGLTAFEVLALAKTEGRLIVPNSVHDGILTKTKDEEYLKQNYPVWTGTLVIYEAPDKPFGEQLVFGDITFQVPEQFQGKVNCALVVEHPHFEIRRISNYRKRRSRPTNPSGFVVHSSSPRKIGDLSKGQTDLGKNSYELKAVDGIHLIEQFPRQDGWYMPHTETGIPQGAIVKKSSDSRSRYLWVLNDDSSYLGPVARGAVMGGGEYKRDVVPYGWNEPAFGVALMPLAAMSSNFDR